MAACHWPDPFSMFTRVAALEVDIDFAGNKGKA